MQLNSFCLCKFCPGVNNLEPIPDLECGRVLFQICQRRKSLIFTTAIFVFLMSVCLCGFSASTYTATNIIQLENPSTGDLRAQADALQSEALALKVIGDLNLQRGQIPLGGQRRVVNAFLAHLKLQVIPGTRQLEVDYTDGDPRLAAAIVNHLVDVFADDSVATITATNPSSKWLEGQLAELRKRSETLQVRLAAQQMADAPLEANLPGKPVIYTSTLARLQRSAVLLAQARMACVIKASLADVFKTGNPELASQLKSASVASAGSQSVQRSVTRIQDLVRRRGMLQLQADRDLSRFKSSSPQLVRDRASMRSLQQSLKEENRRAAERAQQDLTAAVEAERALRAENEVDKTVARQLSDRSIEFATLPVEAVQSRQLYQGLLTRLKNAGMLKVSHSSNPIVVRKADASSSHGNSPVPLYWAFGGGFGVFFGCCFALLVDAVEARRRDHEEGWSLHINGSSIPPIRGMSSSAFKLSARVSQSGRSGPAPVQRKQPVVKPFSVPVRRIVTNPRPSQVGQMGRLILLRPPAGERKQAIPYAHRRQDIS
jgi:succinoglycan biosynthesis transport protein ExoP